MAIENQKSTHKHIMEFAFLLFVLPLFSPAKTGAQSIGVCYGRLGNNLPSDSEVISLYQSNGISKMRIYDPNPSILEALKGSNIELFVDIPRGTIKPLSNPSIASNWVKTNILDYSPDVEFRIISVGNEIDPGEEDAQFILPAIQNIYNAISQANLQDQIKVSTTIRMSLLDISYPPSTGSFSGVASPFINPIIGFLAQTRSPLLVNLYPFFSYNGDPSHINLNYALLTTPEVEVNDGSLEYQNLFDANLDAVYSAVEKAGGRDIEVVVAESGWPSDGSKVASVENAQLYYQNLIDHVKGNAGTPKRPGRSPQVYLFAMFDENSKEGDETERHFGLFSPDKQPKYQIKITPVTSQSQTADSKKLKILGTFLLLPFLTKYILNFLF